MFKIDRRASKHTKLLIGATALVLGASALTLGRSNTASAIPLPPVDFGQNVPAQGECGIDGLGDYVKFTTGGVNGEDLTAQSTGGVKGTTQYDQATGTFTVDSVMIDYDGNGPGLPESVFISELIGGSASSNPIWRFPLGASSPVLDTTNGHNFSQFAICVYRAGLLKFTKTVDAGSGSFTFEAVCRGPNGTIISTTVFEVNNVTAGSPVTVDVVQVPVGATCTISEKDDNPAYTNDGPVTVEVEADQVNLGTINNTATTTTTTTSTTTTSTTTTSTTTTTTTTPSTTTSTTTTVPETTTTTAPPTTTTTTPPTTTTTAPPTTTTTEVPTTTTTTTTAPPTTTTTTTAPPTTTTTTTTAPPTTTTTTTAPPTTTTTAVPTYGLKVVKTATPNPLSPTDTLTTFTVTVTNTGNRPATGVVVTDVVPTVFTIAGTSVTQGTWSAPTWLVGTIAPGGTATLVMKAQIPTTAGTQYPIGPPIRNCANVSASSPDSNSADNESCVTVTRTA